MKAGFLAPPLVHSAGWGRYTIDLIGALGSQGVEATIVTTQDAPDAIDVPHHGYYRLLPSLHDGRRWVTPRALVRAPGVRRRLRGCGVVHCMAEPFAPLAASVAPGSPLFITAYGTYLPRALKRRAVGWLFMWAVRRAERVVCISRYTENQVLAALPGAPTVMIHPGVDWAHFARPADPPEPKRGPVVLGVGHVKTRKGFHIVAEAMQTVRQKHSAAEYVVIGDFTGESALTARLEAMPGVRLLGRVDDATLRAWYHHADVLAQTPITAGDKFEGFGLVYLEAGAAGTPSVGAQGSGAEEAIIDGETGLLVPQNDVQATAEAILDLLNDRALCARLAGGAGRHARANGWDRVAAELVEIYRADD